MTKVTLEALNKNNIENNEKKKINEVSDNCLCTMIPKETIDYYGTNGNGVYCTILDATKSFNHIKYCKLIRLLSIKNVPAVTKKICIKFICIPSCSCDVEINGSYSHDIKILNSVRQGTVLSPVLFRIYFAELILCTPWSQLNMGAMLVSVSLVYLHMLTT